jgi:ComF family protein
MIGSALLDFLYPSRCLVCDRRLEWAGWLGLCRPCYRRLPWIGRTACRVCGRFLPGAVPFSTSCRFCRERTRHFNRGYSALRFAPPARELLIRFKYGGHFGIERPLSNLAARALRSVVFETPPDGVSFVPLFPRKYKERGFNQSESLARGVARRTGLPLARMLFRRGENAPQASLKIEEREKNVSGCFEPRDNAPSWKHVLLVDDVMTSGSTLDECARVLKNADVREVSVLTLLSVADGE